MIESEDKKLSVSEENQRVLFDKIAALYEANYNDECSQRYRREFITKEILKNIDLRGKRVLEAMCGGGGLTDSLISQGALVTGLDISKEQIKIFNQKWKCDSICASMIDSGIEKESFDCVLVAGGLHHLYPFTSEAIQEISRVLKPGGYFCFYEPHRGSIPDFFRRIWYAVDKLAEENEVPIDLLKLKKEFSKDFDFLSETFCGNLAYLLIFNSMFFRIPFSLKKALSGPLFKIERFVKKIQNRRLSCIVIGQWRKKNCRK